MCKDPAQVFGSNAHSGQNGQGSKSEHGLKDWVHWNH